MDIRQLNALVAVVDTGSFSAAAQSLHTVQSNISTHIARLEQELSVSLIDRRTGVLTEEGALVVERARRVQTELESISLDVKALHTEVSGIVRLGVIGTTGRWYPHSTRIHDAEVPKGQDTNYRRSNKQLNAVSCSGKELMGQ